MLKTTLIAGLAIAAATAAQADVKVQIGQLTCTLEDRTNLIITSTTTYDCAFDPAGDGAEERYEGVAQRLGIDLTAKQAETLIWLVFAPGDDVDTGALAGSYVGASAEIAVIRGVGAKLLIGGTGDSFALQPASVSGQSGVGAALAVEEFTLTER